ncbi:DUF262 domain-containing protein [Flavobacterium arcticum]|uniref:DUF262 domain-containing protein n=1 Tax=Flavobacterium arcticum TaxID=1784713 RepID=A0A345HB77_9FLAO|nr:DUF262 domain-containing protein [Flavobacterium arcticum]AXG73837.1 DUF262 domain-containing protein [Flavobacterium arcticum]KAF2511789.1 DUF262 domain-containing protein [Flavobacterium arcticum]
MENFKNVAEKYKIQIPIIQRDYAQGRMDRRASKIREGFLNSIAEVLGKSDELHLDFIYGSVKQDKFIPLDGQQRLTTLYLLYWYFGKKEEKEIDYLKNFTYETRASSREFCSKLVDSSINFLDTSISHQIKDSSWFLAYWENDPSIRAMLNMIDDIHQKFNDKSYYNNLDKITFNFFELEKFGLDDDLYIKMNARGKSLTEFENFKAKFEKYLIQFDNDLYLEFSQKIDNEWTDFFWKYGVNDKSFLIDRFFMNYFGYITEMIYYSNNRDTLTEESDFEQIKSLYRTREQIQFLFKSLDRLPYVVSCFGELFCTQKYEVNKVCLFDDDYNLLEKIIIGQPVNIQQKILLYIIVNHSLGSELDNNLKDLLRVARNLTYRIKHLKNGFIYYTNDLSFENIQSLLIFFLELINKEVYYELVNNDFDRTNTGISESSIQFEIDKAEIIQQDPNIKDEIFRLEDFKYLKGDIHNLLSSDITELHFYGNSIREIFDNKDSLIIRSLLTIDNYSLNIGWTILGDKFYFGNVNNWEVILTAPNKQSFYKSYFESFKLNNNSLNAVVSSYLKTNTNNDWRYYFIKYPEMTSSISDLSKDNNIFSWNGQYSLEKMGGSNLNAYHQNPYITTVAKKLGEQSYIVQYDSFSYLTCKELEVYSKGEGWLIYKFDKDLFGDLIPSYKLVEKKDYFLLTENEDKDRIEILCEFLTDVKERAT